MVRSLTTSVADAELRHEIAYTRQRDWFDPAENPRAHVTIVGVGGIGSPTALALAKLGIPKLTLIDPDIVEAHNLPNQMFPMGSVDDYKTSAVADTLEGFSPIEVETYEVEGQHAAVAYRDVVISGLDSMEARRDLWEQTLRRNIRVPLYLDARLGGENIVVYAVKPHDPDDIEFYETTLHSDEDSKPAPCTRQSIIDVGFIVAGLLTRAVRRHYAGEPSDRTTFIDWSNLTIMKGST